MFDLIVLIVLKSVKSITIRLISIICTNDNKQVGRVWENCLLNQFSTSFSINSNAKIDYSLNVINPQSSI